MDSELNILKSKIEGHRLKNGRRKAFPEEVWQQIFKLSKKIDALTLAKDLGISHPNLLRRLRSQNEQVSLIEAPGPLLKSKQMTVELPHNIILRIDL